MEKISSKGVERTHEAAHVAKRIYESVQDKIIEALRSTEYDDPHSLFQGQVCDILSAMIFSFSIRILQDAKIEQRLIDELCNNHIASAKTIARKATYANFQEH